MLLCEFQLQTKKFHYPIHVHFVIKRDLALHNLTQEKNDCRIIYRIAVTKRQQPCLRVIYRMSSAFKVLLLQWLVHYYDILNWKSKK